MSIPSLKRLLWVMNEILAASPVGITRSETSDKWADSIKNDQKETEISERTFHRIKNDLMELFGCEIICNPTTKRYSAQIPDDFGSDEQLTLLGILLMKEKKSRKDTTINEILQMLTVGNDIPNDDMRAARDLSSALSRLPQLYSSQFLEIAGHGGIKGADRVEKDEYYCNYICVWNDTDFKNTRLWLSIGFYEDEIDFYVVTDKGDSAERQRNAFYIGLEEGIRYRGGYYWHKPSDKNLFSLSFDNKPNMEEVRKRAEILLSRIEKLANRDKTIEH